MSSHNKNYTLGQLANLLDATLIGNPDHQISGIASLQNAKHGQVSFVLSSRYQLVESSWYEKKLMSTQATAIVLSPAHVEKCPVDKLVVDNPYSGYMKLANLFAYKPKLAAGIHSSAVIGTGCNIHATARIGANCSIGDNVTIGADTVIHAGASIGDHVHIGNDCTIWSNVTLYYEVEVGDHVEIHSGAVIGSDGFGMFRDQDGWKKLPQIGSVSIGNHVEIGANTTIDRGTIDNTVIEDGVKLDNQIQIAHNVVIGANTVIAGCVGIAGSVKIGKNCMLGGAVGIADNVEITDNVILTGMANVQKSITKPGIYSSGLGIMPHREWQKQAVRFRHLDDFARRLRELENKKHE